MASNDTSNARLLPQHIQSLDAYVSSALQALGSADFTPYMEQMVAIGKLLCQVDKSTSQDKKKQNYKDNREHFDKLIEQFSSASSLEAPITLSPQQQMAKAAFDNAWEDKSLYRMQDLQIVKDFPKNIEPNTTYIVAPSLEKGPLLICYQTPDGSYKEIGPDEIEDNKHMLKLARKAGYSNGNEKQDGQPRQASPELWEIVAPSLEKSPLLIGYQTPDGSYKEIGPDEIEDNKPMLKLARKAGYSNGNEKQNGQLKQDHPELWELVKSYVDTRDLAAKAKLHKEIRHAAKLGILLLKTYTERPLAFTSGTMTTPPIENGNLSNVELTELPAEPNLSQIESQSATTSDTPIKIEDLTNEELTKDPTDPNTFQIVKRKGKLFQLIKRLRKLIAKPTHPFEIHYYKTLNCKPKVISLSKLGPVFDTDSIIYNIIYNLGLSKLEGGTAKNQQQKFKDKIERHIKKYYLKMLDESARNAIASYETSRQKKITVLGRAMAGTVAGSVCLMVIASVLKVSSLVISTYLPVTLPLLLLCSISTYIFDESKKVQAFAVGGLILLAIIAGAIISPWLIPVVLVAGISSVVFGHYLHWEPLRDYLPDCFKNIYSEFKKLSPTKKFYTGIFAVCALSSAATMATTTFMLAQSVVPFLFGTVSILSAAFPPVLGALVFIVLTTMLLRSFIHFISHENPFRNLFKPVLRINKMLDDEEASLTKRALVYLVIGILAITSLASLVLSCIGFRYALSTFAFRAMNASYAAATTLGVLAGIIAMVTSRLYQTSKSFLKDVNNFWRGLIKGVPACKISYEKIKDINEIPSPNDLNPYECRVIKLTQQKDNTEKTKFHLLMNNGREFHDISQNQFDKIPALHNLLKYLRKSSFDQIPPQAKKCIAAYYKQSLKYTRTHFAFSVIPPYQIRLVTKEPDVKEQDKLTYYCIISQETDPLCYKAKLPKTPEQDKLYEELDKNLSKIRAKLSNNFYQKGLKDQNEELEQLSRNSKIFTSIQQTINKIHDSRNLPDCPILLMIKKPTAAERALLSKNTYVVIPPQADLKKPEKIYFYADQSSKGREVKGERYSLPADITEAKWSHFEAYVRAIINADQEKILNTSEERRDDLKTKNLRELTEKQDRDARKNLKMIPLPVYHAVSSLQTTATGLLRVQNALVMGPAQAAAALPSEMAQKVSWTIIHALTNSAILSQELSGLAKAVAEAIFIGLATNIPIMDTIDDPPTLLSVARQKTSAKIRRQELANVYQGTFFSNSRKTNLSDLNSLQEGRETTSTKKYIGLSNQDHADYEYAESKVNLIVVSAFNKDNKEMAKYLLSENAITWVAARKIEQDRFIFNLHKISRKDDQIDVESIDFPLSKSNTVEQLIKECLQNTLENSQPLSLGLREEIERMISSHSIEQQIKECLQNALESSQPGSLSSLEKIEEETTSIPAEELPPAGANPSATLRR